MRHPVPLLSQVLRAYKLSASPYKILVTSKMWVKNKKIEHLFKKNIINIFN